MRGKFTTSPLKLTLSCAIDKPNHAWALMGHFPTNGPSCESVVWDRGWSLACSYPTPMPYQCLPSTGRQLPMSRQLSPSLLTILGSLCSKKRSFLKEPWMVLRDVLLDISKPNMLVYEFRTSHMNLSKKIT